jgi:hypothetical protein
MEQLWKSFHNMSFAPHHRKLFGQEQVMSIPLIQKVKLRLRAAGVELDHTVKWQVTKTHLQPEGFHFTCDNPLTLQRMAENSRRMARDLNYPTPVGFDRWQETSVGFTEIGEGARVHLDVAIRPAALCRVFIDPDSHVVGRDRAGDALRDLRCCPKTKSLENNLFHQIRGRLKNGIPREWHYVVLSKTSN